MPRFFLAILLAFMALAYSGQALAQDGGAYPVDGNDLAAAHRPSTPAPEVITIPAGFELVPTAAAGALPARPAFEVPRGFALVPAASLAAPGAPSALLTSPTEPEAPEPWWKPLIKNPEVWALVFTLAMGIWGFFHKKSRDDFREAFREVVSIAFHATEEDYGLGILDKSEKRGHFLEEVTAGLTGRGFAKLAAAPATLAMAKAAAKALNAPSPTSSRAAEEPTEDPTPAPSEP